MKKLSLLFGFLLFIQVAMSTNYYVAPNGSDNNNGLTTGSPWLTLTKAGQVLAAKPGKGAGDTVFVRGGTYVFVNPPANGYAQMLIQNINGTASAPCVITNYPNEQPIFDFTAVVPNSTRPSPTGLSIFSSNYLKVKGLRLTGYRQIADGSGVSRGIEWNNCNWCVLDQCEVDHFQGTGFFISASTFDCTYLNCDSHHNEDPLSADGSGVPGSDKWDNADGYGITGAGNTTDRIVFNGCRAWLCCDDGWDFIGTNGKRTLIGCQAFLNGYYQRVGMPVPLAAGNGNGFKLGNFTVDKTNTDTLRIVEQCLSVYNRANGFDQNGVPSTVYQIYNNTAYKNGNYGFQFQYYDPVPYEQKFRNNIGYQNGSGAILYVGGNTYNTNNSWNAGYTVTNADFVSIDSSGISGPRGAGGALPVLNFMKLVPGSDLVNTGINVGIAFCGPAPDLGCYELCNALPTVSLGADRVITLPTNTTTFTPTTSGATSYQWLKYSGPATYNITSPTTANTTINNLVQGVYGFSLTVTNAQGSVTDSVLVTVNAAPATNPTCSAGASPVTITLPINTVALSGTGASTSGNTVSYAWTQTAGAAVTINNANTANATAVGLTAGSRTFLLTVTDNVNLLTCTSSKVVVTNPAVVAPTANAGVDQTITLPTNSVNLTGSGTGGSGTITGYGWVKVTGGAATITSPSSQNTSVTGMVAGIYTFALTVTASTGLTASDTMQVTVLPALNIPPTANAGPNQTITLPVNQVTLSGSGTDTDGTIVSYGWLKLTGTGGTISIPSAQTTTITGLTAGIYTVQLTVTDNNGAQGRDTMQITVNAAPATNPTCSAGASPVTITLPINTVALSGTGASTNGNTVSYAWTQTAGAAVTINNANTANATAIGLTAGSRTFLLTVTDNVNLLTCTSSKVVVTNPAVVAPTANAGVDQTITLPTNSVNLTGSGTGGSGTITGYGWVKVSGGAATITSPSSQNTSVTGMVAGIYKFAVTVTASTGLTASDTMQVTVLPALNVPPTANAGPNQTITLPVNQATLSGSGTDTDGTIISYGWVKITGTGGTIVAPSAQTTTITGLTAGVYTVQLTVTDNNGAQGRDTVQITVNVAPNVPPVANAGGDKTITLPINFVALNGSGSTDSDGTIVSYLWTKLSGTGGSITNPNIAVTQATGLVVGLYTYELTVTDNNAATGKDTIQVSVYPVPVLPPTANAGPDQSITSPVSTVSLTGSGSAPGSLISTYEWVKVSGTGGTIVSPTSQNTSVTGLTPGTYLFALTVGDTTGLFGSDTMQVTVFPVAPPIVNAGTDQSIKSPLNMVTLTGTASGASVLTYAWTKVSGPTCTIASPTALVTNITGLNTIGTYVFKLTATDSLGNTGSDNVQVNVSASPDSVRTIVDFLNASVDNNNNILLQWGAKTTSNTQSFTMYRKWLGLFYVSIKSITPVTGNYNYRYVDTGSSRGNNQYKMTSKDKDGFTSSKEASIKKK